MFNHKNNKETNNETNKTKQNKTKNGHKHAKKNNNKKHANKKSEKYITSNSTRLLFFQECMCIKKRTTKYSRRNYSSLLSLSL